MTPYLLRGSFPLAAGAGRLIDQSSESTSPVEHRSSASSDSLQKRLFFRRSPVHSAKETLVGPTETGGLRRTDKLARLEAALFVSDSPLTARKLAQHATLADAAEATRLIQLLNHSYDAGGSSFRIEHVASGYQMLTRPIFATWLGRLHQRQLELKLSPPALETLTIVAYRQPITRADIESLRGVQCTEMLKQLMERGLVRIAGEDDSLGRPYLYETTRRFLETFGLRHLNELPMAEQLRKPGGSQPAASTDTSDEVNEDLEDDDLEDDEDFDEEDDEDDDDEDGDE